MTFATDRDGQIIRRDFQENPVGLVVQHDLPWHRWLERLDNHLFRVSVVFNNVDLLATQFADNRLHPSAAGADTRANGIHLRIAARHGNFRAITRLTGERLDFYRAVGDLGDFELEKTPHKLGARAAEDDLRTTRRALNFNQEAADALARLVFLAWDLLLTRHNGLSFAKVYVEIVAFTTADRAGDDVADLILKVVVNTVFFELAQTLHDRLTRRLRGNAAERRWINFLFNQVADYSARL